MANDAATVWISPHFTTQVQEGSPPGMDKENVWVLNTNDTPETVTVIFYDMWGTTVEEQVKLAEPWNAVWFEASEDVGGGNAWVRVFCDKPVLPWGVCLQGNNVFRSYVQMAFYRAEPDERRQQSELAAEVRKK